jgi:hypothetical protein
MRAIVYLLSAGLFFSTTMVPPVAAAGTTGIRETVPLRFTRSWHEIAVAAEKEESQQTSRVPPLRRGPGPTPIGGSAGTSVSSPDHAASYISPGRNLRMTEARADAAPPALSFDALLDNNTAIPPDTHGSAGPLHLMTLLNSQMRVQDKLGAINTTISIQAFFSDPDAFDPRVHYDAVSGRWFASSTDSANTTHPKINLAVSTTSNPLDAWHFYQFSAAAVSDDEWADYPRFGFNNKWIAICANMFKVNGGFNGSKMWVIDISTPLAGGALTMTTFPTKFDLAGGVSGFTLQPCITYTPSDTLFIVDNSNLFSSNDTTFLIRLSRITGTGPSPVWSVAPNSPFPGSGTFFVAHNFNASQIDAPQMGSATAISTNDDRMLNAVYRNGRIWCTHSGGLPAKIAPAPNRTSVFWYQINPAAMPAPIVQSGVIDGGTGVHLFFPSIAANVNDDAVLGFTRSDATRFAEAVFAGRLPTDPPGTTQAVQLIKAGEGVYTKFFGGMENRWGDYSNTCVDPADSLTFWTIQEYAGTPVGTGVNSGRWATRWAKIEAATSLPVQLASFSGEASSDGSVHLAWTTLTEKSTYGFEVERSVSMAGQYQTIEGSFVAGHGTTLERHEYAYVDRPGTSGRWWYRLRQIDLDETFRYSDGIAVDFSTGAAGGQIPAAFSLVQSFPNPFNPTTTIRYGIPILSHVTLTVFNALGQQVVELVNGELEAGYHEVKFDGTNLASGVYFYEIQAGSFAQTKRLLLLR